MNIRLLIAFSLSLLVSCAITNETVSYQYQNYSINEVSDSISDDVFAKILAPYKDSVENAMSEVIAESAVEMINYRPESPLSNLTTDMVLTYSVELAHKLGYSWSPQFALVNNGSLRTSLPKGEITLRHAFELMPFENKLIMLKLTGQQVIELANYLVTREGEGVSGISFGMATDHAVNIKVQGLMIDTEKSYWMATSDYIANGGDGMKILTWAEDRIETDIKMRDLIIEKMKESYSTGIKLSAQTDGRIYYDK